MKKVIFILSTIILLSCSGESIEVTNDQNLSIDENPTTVVDVNTRREIPNNDVSKSLVPFNTRLMAGQNIEVGSVSVIENGTNLEVTYTITDPNWTIVETHLYTGDCGQQPMNGQGNPQVGRFPYKEVHDPAVSTFTYSIDLLGLSDSGCIAAHAVVVSADGTITHTAWGEGDSYGVDQDGNPGNNWAMIFGYTMN